MKLLTGIILIIVLFEGCHCIFGTSSALVESAFKKSKIVSDIIDKAPKRALKVAYKNNKELNLGKNTFSTLEVALKPKISYEADPNDLYTLLLIEPDRPAPECHGTQMLHWQVVNIPGNDVDSGVELAFYIQPVALPIGRFRYTFLLLKQKEEINVNLLEFLEFNTLARLCFNTTKFIQDYNMEVVEGNFFMPTSILPNLNLSL